MSEVKTEWDLEKHFFKSIDDPKINKGIEIDEVDLNSGLSITYKGKISSLSDEDFLEFLNTSSNLNKNMTKAYRYFSYLNTLDTQDQSVIKKDGRTI